MARKKQETPETLDTPGLDGKALTEVQNLAGSIAGIASEERDLANQILGQVQMARSISRFADVVSLTKLAQIKESKLYRGLQGKKGFDPDGNEIADVGTWDGFCQALGLSRSKVDEDLTNLQAFGEEAMKQLSAVGAGYRELRQYRRLGEDQRAELIEVAKSGDKEAFVDLAEEIISRHVQEKAALTNKVADAQADHNIQSQLLAEKNTELHTLRVNLEKAQRHIQMLPADKKEEAVRLELAGITTGAESAIVVNLATGFNQLLEMDANGVDPRPFMAAQLRQLEIAIARMRADYDLEDVGAEGGADWLNTPLSATPAAVEG
jgi:hypothetical protein